MRDHQRKSELYAKSFIAAADVDEAETNLKITQRDYEEAKEVLERRSIRSPVDGVVTQRMLEAGARVEAEPIMKLARISPLYAEVIASASLLGSVKIGDAVAVKPEVHMNKNEYIGHVKIVDTVVDAASGTFGIRIEIENKDQSLPAGLKCKARFLGQQKAKKAADTKQAPGSAPSGSPEKRPTP
jgi:RND family efflux transporter MFP subunit